MRLGPRIVLYIALTCILPLLGLAVIAERVARLRIEQRLTELQVESARLLAADLVRSLDDQKRLLILQLSSFRLETASDPARAGFLALTCRLLPDLRAVALLDPSGSELVAPLGCGGDAPPGWTDRAPLGGSQGTSRVGAPVLEAGGVWVPMTVSSPSEPGVTLAVMLDLSGLEEQIGDNLTDGREVAVLGPGGEVLTRAGEPGLVEPERYRALLSTGLADLRYESEDGAFVVAATAGVADYGWVVAVAERADASDAASADLRARTWFICGIALACATAMGVFFTRSVVHPVLRLRRAAQRLGAGDLGTRVAVTGRDEVAELSVAFNQMAESLERHASEIDAKNRQIESFNSELQARVERRTAQLKEAQSRLVSSGQLAAVAEIASGVAHELNNPLAGILGVVQIVAARRGGTADEALLRSAEEQAFRCKEIVAVLLRFADPEPTRTRAPLDLGALLTEVLGLMAPALRQRGVSVSQEIATGLLVVGEQASLGRALSQLLSSVRALAAPGASLKIRALRRSRLVSADGATGPVVAPDDRVTEPPARFPAEAGGSSMRIPVKEVVVLLYLSDALEGNDDWRAAGMGLWVARRVFQEHAAELSDLPVQGRGRSWQLAFVDPAV